MAEVKNAFIKSKMNKDLDDRLLPSGEYRHAQNAQVSKSEGSDVGALENILGNSEMVDLTQSIPNVSSIGYFVENSNNIVYVFLTDNINNNYTPTGAGSNHFIYKYNIATDTASKLVEGAFLNFSKLNPIFGVNLLEDLLFWTDNRNQPRKINVKKDLGYYTSEDQISVAKYYPFQSIELFKESELDPGEYETTMKDVVSKNLPNGGSATISSAVSNSSTFNISNLDIPTFPNEVKQGFTVGYVSQTGEIVDTLQTVSTYVDPTLTLTGNVIIPLVGSATEIVFNFNPYYNEEYSGDSSFLEDKFIRFSYRFKFDDGEYSLIAPFTQPCFIPKQDGYFLNTIQDETYPNTASGDEDETISSTVVKFMENKVNNIYLQIPLPCSKDNLKSSLHVEEIDIIYKESDGLALQVVETIKVDQNFTGTESVFEYDYQAKKPYKTLPSNETTRVYDKVPLKALSQEVISNRIVYGNYVNKPTPPQSLNYNIAATEKFDFSIDNDEHKTSVVEYPSSSLKTNRDYQVGFVLADKFGRQSSVILSNNQQSITVGTVTYTGSTLYSPYINEDIGANIDSWKGNSLKILLNAPIPGGITGLYNDDIDSIEYNPTGWYSYKVVVKQTQQDYYNVYLPGAIKGDPIITNPTNLNNSYISLHSDNINKVPRDLSEVGPTQNQFRSSVKLYGRVDIDNVTASNNGNDNSQFYPGKTFFTSPSIQDIFGTFGIERFDDTQTGYARLSIFQNWQSDPLVSTLTTSQDSDLQFGILTPNAGSGSMKNLAVLETEPEESRLDIFWETSTSGTISDINSLVSGGSLVAGFSNSYNLSGFDESLDTDDNISSGSFTLIDTIGADIPVASIDSFVLDTVFTTQTTPNNVSSFFELYRPDPVGLPGFYNVKVTSEFLDNVFYGSDQGLRVWNFSYTAVIDGVTNIIEKQVSLNNVAPTMTPNGNLTVDTDGSTSVLTTLTAVNGANSNNPNTGLQMNWFIDSQTGDNSGAIDYFSLNFSNTDRISTCDLLNDNVGLLVPDIYTVTIKAEDAGGEDDQIIVRVNNSVRINYVRQYSFVVGLNTYTFTVISATDSTDSNRTGYYSYLDSWDNLAVVGFAIDIDYTNSAKSGCPTSPNKWIFKQSEGASINQAVDCLLPGTTLAPGFINIDVSDYSFTIV